MIGESEINDSLTLFFCTASLAMFASGCQSQISPPTTEASVRAESDGHDHDGHDHADGGESDVVIAMAKLSSEDRKEAEAQKYCAVMSTSLLGSMGTPLKLDVKGQPVFVCCAGCKSKALKNADETLAAVAKMKAENSGSQE